MLSVLVVPHSIHLVLLLLLPPPVDLPLHYFHLYIHNALASILIHGTLSRLDAVHPKTTRILLLLVFHNFECVVTGELVA